MKPGKTFYALLILLCAFCAGVPPYQWECPALLLCALAGLYYFQKEEVE